MVDALHDSLGLSPEGGGENGGRNPKKKRDDTDRLAGVEPAPSEDHGKVIVLQGPDAEPMPEPDPTDLRAAHLLQGAIKDGRGDLYVAEVALSGGGRAGLVPPTCHTLQKFVRLE